MRATHGECDALFVAVEGGLSYEVFLLGLADGVTGLEPDVLGRHVVPAEALLQALPRLRDFLAPRFLSGPRVSNSGCEPKGFLLASAQLVSGPACWIA